ncbi:MAG: hypothetical protein BWX73_00571 [Lentisphaerae bacterium ADurb.Bin082]|nr:MAG: hypothetical protein BWX73_00571 [Lentisphaerae bacterium ADurb.Bin082]
MLKEYFHCGSAQAAVHKKQTGIRIGDMPLRMPVPSGSIQTPVNVDESTYRTALPETLVDLI